MSDRRYHVWIEVTEPKMANFGQKIQLTVEPALTHDEACVVMRKHTKYPWRRMFLVEVSQ